MSKFPFSAIDWDKIPKTEFAGEKGTAFWQTVQFEGLRVRIVEYSAGYFADHWCRKGHLVHCLAGEFVTEQKSGENFTLSKGMTYLVSDDFSAHRSSSENGVTLLIIDGDFLSSEK